MLVAFFTFGMLLTVFYLIALIACLVWTSRRRRAREEASRMVRRRRKIGDKAFTINYSLIVHVWSDGPSYQKAVDFDNDYNEDSFEENNLVQTCAVDVENSHARHALTAEVPINLNDVKPVIQDDDDGVCAICLVSFQRGDIYGQSSNPSCRHIFHQDCIVGWLITKDDGTCPCCRQPYLARPFDAEKAISNGEHV